MKNQNISLKICIVVVISALLFHFGVEYYKKQVTQKVINYLVLEKGYQSTDIAEIKTYISKAPVVSTSVIFKDERNAMYMYKSDNGQMEQYHCIPAINDLKQKYIHAENP
ncbi:DUF3139 domain-containing protein [Paenibacillus sp. PsM32]|uniref:DUF3139 domain-containing protein n=1 Tax=Paenibacillus kyungheensis TaxID=1452732 RepID=A0AAX3M091_9BACL|nr:MULTISPECIES: DUF3139 domain-containing protein [Paenibacillus]MDN4620429.1 DUF3139 domain-containing protein [Paenibacillus sp. PsM32]MDQ1235649.1 hypothetical protein [Paenibacillus sp. SORGH_AS_0306]MDR6112698.1 hypothetical protein [Paenibacillus sp. SORGH_AS_0338]WCT55156.1 DUF3139 domain-containing protein [Paenibacillus kyungheensis]